MSTAAAKVLIDAGAVELKTAQEALTKKIKEQKFDLEPLEMAVEKAAKAIRSFTKAVKLLCAHDTGYTIKERDVHSGTHGRDIDTEYTRVCKLCDTVLETSWVELK